MKIEYLHYRVTEPDTEGYGQAISKWLNQKTLEGWDLLKIDNYLWTTSQGYPCELPCVTMVRYTPEPDDL